MELYTWKISEVHQTYQVTEITTGVYVIKVYNSKYEVRLSVGSFLIW